MDEKTLVRFSGSYSEDSATGCWVWHGSKTEDGYGRFYAHHIRRKAHIWAYEHYVGLVTKGKELDHLCRNRLCVRPDHLEPVTHRENVLRGNGPAALVARNIAIRLARTHCKQGHLIDKENSYITPIGYKECRVCRRVADAKYRASRKGGVR